MTFARGFTVGVLCCACCGLIAGLVIGLTAYAPTAPFAAVELAVLATVLGAPLVALVMLVVRAGRRRHS